ncbi:MAG TPA: hypothetical protein VMW38_13130 [Terriglobia bacterium]|nr:hypothetical protein [Terriglobia bacterium]
MAKEQSSVYKVITQTIQNGEPVQLVCDGKGSYFLRRHSICGEQLGLSAPLHSDPAALAEARELFPDHLPFGGLPVDAT